MLTMAEKTFLGLAITLSVVLAGIAVLPTFSYEVSLVTSPDKEVFFIPAGQPFNITCKGLGDDANKFSTLKWLNKNGQVILDGVPGALEVENSLTLTFADPKEDQSGVYKCLATYEKSQTLEKSVSIIFHGDKPAFEDEFQNITATENSLVEILCAAEGESPITYEWYNENDDKIIQKSNSSVFVSNVANASVLTITSVTLDHAGLYTCLAANRHGSTSKIFQLDVLPGNGNDTTNETTYLNGVFVVNVTTTSVKFSFITTGRVNSIEVLYYESRNKTEIFEELNYGGAYEIKDLIPAGLYTFKFRTNPSENNQWSGLYQVVLLPEKPEVIFRSIDSGTIKIEWIFKYENRVRKTIDKHEISYFMVQRRGMEEEWKPSGCPITITVPECASSFYTIAGLGEQTYYEIQLRAHTTSGYSEPYTQRIFFPR